MSTIKSSDEHLTLNADGSSKDIKFQANGVEKASIDSSGNLTVSGNITSGNNGSVFLLDNAGQKSGQIETDSSSANALNIDADPDNSAADSYTAFRIDNSEKMRINSAGNVGIGTTTIASPENNAGPILQIGNGSNAMSSIVLHEDGNKWEVVSNNDLIIQDESVVRLRIAQAGDITFSDTSQAAKVTIKNDGKVGIGEASPTAARLHITTNDQGTLPSLQADADDVVIENSTPGITLMGATNGGGMLAFGDTADADVGRIFYYHVNNNMDFVTNGDTRLSLRSDGQLRSFVPASASKTNMSFYNGGVIKGSIVTSDYTNNTTYNTSSDYRLKENVDYTWDATTRLKQLKPARFNWIADDTNTLFDGFIAHEVQEIIPEAITGEKDAMTTNENGDAIIDPQGIDQSKLVPLLVKTIQELEARIAALEA